MKCMHHIHMSSRMPSEILSALNGMHGSFIRNYCIFDSNTYTDFSINHRRQNNSFTYLKTVSINHFFYFAVDILNHSQKMSNVRKSWKMWYLFFISFFNILGRRMRWIISDNLFRKYCLSLLGSESLYWIGLYCLLLHCLIYTIDPL